MNKKKLKIKDVDQQLADSIFTLEQEWKQIRSFVEKSIDSIDSGFYLESLVQAKYLYLLREARHRKIRAIRYD